MTYKQRAEFDSYHNSIVDVGGQAGPVTVQTLDVEKGSIETYRDINHSPGLQHVWGTLFLNNVTLDTNPTIL